MLAGFHAMDEHFREAPFERRTCRPDAGLLGVWYADFFGAADGRGAALRPVPAALPRLPAAADDGVQRQARHASTARRSTTRPAPIYWGEPGTNGQHSFYQLIHQGTELIPCDFIGFCAVAQPARRPPRPADGERVRPDRGAGLRQDGRGGPRRGHAGGARPAPHLRGQPPVEHDPRRRASTPRRSAPSSRSTSTASSRRAPIWGIDSFDQWGVELGKVLAKRIIPELAGRRPSSATTARPTR